MTNLLLLRHGQTAFNARGTIQGHLPTPLNELGHAQAARLAVRLAAFTPRIEYLVTSDLRRAEETAAPVEAALGLRATRDPRWRERSFGEMEGKTVGDTEIWRAANGTLDPPGAEPIPALEERILGALEWLSVNVRDHRSIAVVTHGGAMRTALRLLADGRLRTGPDHAPVAVEPILNASILHLAFARVSGATEWRVIRVNDVDHLDESRVTSKDAG
jgi:probable phosphoglycerate mutase